MFYKLYCCHVMSVLWLTSTYLNGSKAGISCMCVWGQWLSTCLRSHSDRQLEKSWNYKNNVLNCVRHCWLLVLLAHYCLFWGRLVVLSGGEVVVLNFEVYCELFISLLPKKKVVWILVWSRIHYLLHDTFNDIEY